MKNKHIVNQAKRKRTTQVMVVARWWVYNHLERALLTRLDESPLRCDEDGLEELHQIIHGTLRGIIMGNAT